jgi:hypothetical protein
MRTVFLYPDDYHITRPTMSQREEDKDRAATGEQVSLEEAQEQKPTRKSMFEDERIPKEVREALLRTRDRLRARGSDMVQGELKGTQIVLNPPQSWRPKKTEEQQPQGAEIQALQQEEEKKTKWSIVWEEIRDFLSYLLGYKIK